MIRKKAIVILYYAKYVSSLLQNSKLRENLELKQEELNKFERAVEQLEKKKQNTTEELLAMAVKSRALYTINACWVARKARSQFRLILGKHSDSHAERSPFQVNRC